MAKGINRVVYSALFWETLERLRGHARYPALRAQFHEFLALKQETCQRVNQRDGPFNSHGPLSNIWHWACSRNPDVVLFYTIESGTLTMAMVGDHHDYTCQGRGARATERTAKRIANAVSGHHVPSPGWKSISWRRPSDIIRHPDISELSKDALQSLASSLRKELDEGCLYERLFGVSVLDAGTEAFDAWIAETEAALRVVGEAMKMSPSTPEVALDRALAHRAPAFAP